MKATGIVRRIDDLGRVIIPKDVRRIMHIREGDPLEVFVDNSSCVIFRKYSPLGALSEVKPVVQTIAKVTGLPCCITDKSVVLEVSGISSREIFTKRISSETLKIIEAGQQWISDDSIPFLENIKSYQTQHIFPIISEGEIVGSIILLYGCGQVTEKDIAVCNSMAQLIGLQAE